MKVKLKEGCYSRGITHGNLYDVIKEQDEKYYIVINSGIEIGIPKHRFRHHPRTRYFIHPDPTRIKSWVETWQKVEQAIYVGNNQVIFGEHFVKIGKYNFSRESIKFIRDIPRETYDKIIERLK